MVPKIIVRNTRLASDEALDERLAKLQVGSLTLGSPEYSDSPSDADEDQKVGEGLQG